MLRAHRWSFALISFLAPVACFSAACVGELASLPSDAGSDAASADAGAEAAAEAGDAGTAQDDVFAPPLDAANDTSIDATPDAPPAFSPRDVAGLALWLRPDPTSMTVVAGKVTAWRDASGQANDVTQATGSAQPSFVAKAGTGAGVVFDGTQQWLGIATTLGIPAGKGRTLIVVARVSNDTQRSPLLTQNDPADTGSNFYIVDVNTYQTAGKRFGVYAGGNSFDSIQPVQTQSYCVQTLRARDIKSGDAVLPAIDYHYNGHPRALSVAAGTGNAPSTPAPKVTTIGGSWGSNASSYAAAVIVEAMIYGEALSDPDLANVEAYLKTVHAIP